MLSPSLILKIYLLERQCYSESLFHLLVSPLNGCQGRGWARWNQERWSGIRDPRSWAIFVFLRHISKEPNRKRTSWASNSHPYGYQCCGCRLNPLLYNASPFQFIKYARNLVGAALWLGMFFPWAQHPSLPLKVHLNRKLDWNPRWDMISGIPTPQAAASPLRHNAHPEEMLLERLLKLDDKKQ